MVFWIAILSGVLFVWLAVRMGFYDTWVLLFNIVVSVYVAIFLAPTVADFAPSAGGGSSWGTALSLLVLAGGCFALLQGLSFVFLTGQFSIPFPRMFDILLSGVLGFAAGFLVLSFGALVLATTPLVENDIVTGIGLGPEAQRANISCIAWCCDLVHSVASAQHQEHPTQAAVKRLLEASKRQVHAAKPQADVNEPLRADQPSMRPPQGNPDPGARPVIRKRPGVDPLEQ